MIEASRKTAGADGRMAREPGQGLTAAAISEVVRAVATLVVFPAALSHTLSIVLHSLSLRSKSRRGDERAGVRGIRK